MKNNFRQLGGCHKTGKQIRDHYKDKDRIEATEKKRYFGLPKRDLPKNATINKASPLS